MRQAFSLIEMIFVIVIISFLSGATYKAFEMILIRSFKAKEITRLSTESQVSVNVISSYLKNRVPYTVIGYNSSDGSYKYIGNLTSDDNMTILEWYGLANEAFELGDYSGFMDMATKDSATSTIASQNSDGSLLNDTEKKKFNSSDDIYANKIVNLIFAGSFDRGYGGTHDYNDTFGWHGGNSYDAFDFTMDSEGNITIDDSDKPEFIYEKYFVVDTAYAIARGSDIDQAATCIDTLAIKEKDLNNTLLLFSNYRPWKGETFCADKAGNTEGNVSVLMQHIAAFRFEDIDYTIRVGLDINRTIRGSKPIHLSKMKVIF